ncbi:MAG: cytochrome c [Gammaproteobacteria bacterium]
MRDTLVLVATMLSPLAAAAGGTGDRAPPGAESCYGCHRSSGADPGPVPSLAGLSAASIAEAMRAFRAGERTPTVMDRIARGYSAEEVERLATWLASQR